ncbi:hypothetical protein ACWV26_06450 [Rummeliibacillus sp. JY-2-4R]
MVNEKFEMLYEEIYAPKLLPMDLLENLKLENYLDVNFHSENGAIIAITKCLLPSGYIANFRYKFVDNKLISLVKISENEVSQVIYDRNHEILKLMQELKDYTLTNVC